MERLRQIPIFNTETAKNSIREDLLRKRAIGRGRLGFMSGAILHDPFSPSRNAERIYRYQRYARNHLGFPIVSALNYLPQETLLRLSDRTTSVLDKYWESEGHENHRFWQENIEAGYFTHVIFTPESENLMPAIVEYNLARRNGIAIFHINDKRQLPSSSR